MNNFLFLLLGQKMMLPGIGMGSSFAEAGQLNSGLVQKTPRNSEIQGLAESQEFRTDLPQWSPISNGAQPWACSPLGILM